jgi:hypothetical protein
MTKGKSQLWCVHGGHCRTLRDDWNGPRCPYKHNPDNDNIERYGIHAYGGIHK